MPYMVSYMRCNPVTTASSASKNLTTYGDFIAVQSAWGFTQGCVLPVGGALVAALGVHYAVCIGSSLFALAPVITAYTIK